MARFSKKTVDDIIRLIKADTYTIAEICQQVGICQRTYHNWKENHPEFAEAIKSAEDDRMQMFVHEARKSLLKKVKGYDATETKVVTIPDKRNPNKPMIKEQVTTKKHIPADTAAIIFTLTNGEPERWKNRQSAEITGKDGKDLFAGKTDEELDERINELKRKLQ